MSTNTSTTQWIGGPEWDDVLIAGLCVDSLGVLVSTLMLGYIVAYRQYQSTKDRIIALVGLTSLLFLASGSIPQRVHVHEHGRLTPLPFVTVFLSYTWWWMLLIVETCLLAYSLHVILHVRRSGGKHQGSILRPLNVTLGAELAVLVVAVLVSVGVSSASAYEYERFCTKPHEDADGRELNGITSDDCVRHYNTINWAWIAFLVVPFVLQICLWYNCALTRRTIAHLTAESDLDRSSGLAMALERVVANIVRPLQWYPLIFLFFAALYMIWVITLYGADRNAKWAHEVGPVTSMAFSLKGVSVAFVFFSTQTYSGKERSFPQQILFRCGWKSQSYSNFPEHLDEALMGDNGYGVSAAYANSGNSGGQSLYGEESEQDLFATGSSLGTNRSRFNSDASRLSNVHI
eukprot:m.202346 g.202346  ORF g.202346 m.202346 type:complete len:404 (-) comp25245_c0_seq1:610-1821(-)